MEAVKSQYATLARAIFWAAVLGLVVFAFFV